MTSEGIADLFEENGLTLVRTATESNPFMPGGKEDLKHIYCTLSGGGIDSFEFYFSHTADLSPSDHEIVELLIKDIKTYRGCAGYAEFLLVFKLNDDEDRADLAVAWEELGRLAPLVKQVIDLDQTNAPAAPSAPGMRV
jgi:hypothetical protein|nr:hypothetical protein [Neorhizobium tomejilense]